MKKWETILAGFLGPYALWFFLWRSMTMTNRGRVKIVGIYAVTATVFVYAAIVLSLLITVLAWRTMIKNSSEVLPR